MSHAKGMDRTSRTLQVRQLKIDFSHGFSRRWLGGDAFRTQLFNAQSFSFPIGEQYFIDSVRAALPLLTDEALKAEVKGFIGQEASHRHLHTQFNAQLNAQGLSYLIEPFVSWRVRSAARLSVKSNLAITMAYEHFTAIFSDACLSETSWIADAEEPLKTLWTWHSIEETEHKSVAFDVYHAIGGGYVARIAWFIYVSLLFAFDTTVQTLHCLYRAGELFKPATWWQGLRYCLRPRGLIWFTLPHYLAYFKPGFKPWDRDNLHLTTHWLTEQAGNYRALGRPTES
ncbi:metal-dependent hydrolase [Undibacterium sp. TS12]|uniref:metal-dependent hydrolase n=1 Tax=Undibacterium sp. TS12 TaxID=2908202 RepID=UPI001F4CE4DA|nr:metal-dependent hydrolase [Undibacterium sp. TS12]MCH8619984.1 metal-dependent hydrolase [Undibacterium sp. TS12]